MALHIIKVPDLGEGVVEAELVAWNVQPGDRVHEDQPLADVMTDKASVEIPSPVAGRVVALGAEIGTLMRVGSELIRLEVDAGGAAVEPQAPPARAPAPVQAAPAPTARSAAATSAPRPNVVPIASPAVRRRAWELGLDLADVSASGTGGRIMQADLDAALQRGVPRRAAPAPAAAPAAPPPPAFAAAPDTVESVPVIGLRRKIALQMQKAKRQIPHFTYVEEIDVGELEALRLLLNGQYPQRARLTLLPFLMRAVVVALRDFPQINARLDDDKGIVARHAAVHIGIATQTRSGLMVPVVRHAEALDLWGSAQALTSLAEAARAGTVTRDQLSGSTITITSLGPLGGIVTTPIINHPEVAIIGVNRIVERLVMLRGMPVGRPCMNLSSSFDHRVVDGMDAARFIQAIRGLLEAPATLFVA